MTQFIIEFGSSCSHLAILYTMRADTEQAVLDTLVSSGIVSKYEQRTGKNGETYYKLVCETRTGTYNGKSYNYEQVVSIDNYVTMASDFSIYPAPETLTCIAQHEG